MLVLGLVAIDSGLNLLGSPFSFSKLPPAVWQSEYAPAAEVVVQPEGILPGAGSYYLPGLAPTEMALQPGQVVIDVRNNGYEPKTAPPFRPRPPSRSAWSPATRLRARAAFVIPSLDVMVLLEQTGVQTIEIPAQHAGTRMDFSCSMGMYTGVILFQ